MDCSKISYCISEYIDNRLDAPTRKNVEQHLEVCEKCKSLYEEMIELRGLFMVKSYERPKPDYFEHLKSNIKRRILSHNIVSFRERFFKTLSTPSVALSACLAAALVASLAVNVAFYGKIQENMKIASDEHNQHVTRVAAKTNNVNRYAGKVNSNLVHSASANGSYMITPISVRDVQAKRPKIYY